MVGTVVGRPQKLQKTYIFQRLRWEDRSSGRQDQPINRGRETECLVEPPRVAIEGVDRHFDMRGILPARPVDDGAEHPPSASPAPLIGTHDEIVEFEPL